MSTDAVKSVPTLPADSHGLHALAPRRDSHRDLPDPTASSDETRTDSPEELSPSAVSEDIREKALPHTSLDPKAVPIQAQHRSTGLVPAFLARISSITSRGTGLASPEPVSSNRSARRALVRKTSSLSIGIGSKTRPGNQESRAAQAPSPSHSSDHTTSTARDHQDAQKPSDNNPRRQRARRASSVSFVSSLGPSGIDERRVGKAGKMHQTSSRLLRMTDDDRPFTRRHYALTTSSTSPMSTRSNLSKLTNDSSMSTPSNLSKLTNASSIPSPQRSTNRDITTSTCTFQKLYLTLKTKQDFKDLFSTLMVSLPLTPHRVRFQKIDHTFTSEEAITNLGSLKFSQSNRMPDPKDPSRIVTTTTTTTFSMAKEMARSVCTKFLEARFIETADGKSDFSSKSAVWQLTPKGMHILQRFCQRNGINQRHVFELLASPRNTMNLVLLERQAETDKIHRDLSTLEVVFRRFVGSEPNVKYSTSNSDSDSLSEYQTGLVGVKLAKERKVGDKTYHNTFTGKACADWLMDCCTMVDKRETNELAQLFCDFGLMRSLEATGSPPNARFNPSKSAIYVLTERGQRVAGWIPSAKSYNADVSSNGRIREPGTTRDSNTNRMTIIIGDPALRLLFREFLRDTHCEENLAFYLDVRDFLANYNAAKRHQNSPKLEVIRETLAAAYSLYNAFLAPGSPCELNIDHSLRTSLAARMTRAVGPVFCLQADG
ncbi:hypothetical protein EG327_002840 [Venturia inaequalis]|uniref:Developmental regulator flbA n=1 Tax=Venturia inaequalis TaxID=5025 RepID=A0A8H3U430_VENIN|nr:hypothetical protein EG327_002840 [Venturia inaequalis]